MLDVFFYEAFEEEEALLKRSLPPGVRAGFAPLTLQERGDTAPPAAIISIRTQSLIPSAWAGSIRAVLTRSTGYDHVAAFREKTGAPLPCGYLPSYCARAVAEHAALLWLALLRRLPLQARQMDSFNRDGLTGSEAAGRCLLVAGVGHIGHEVAAIGRGLGMEVLGMDIVRRFADITYVDAEEGLRRADVIVCAMSLNNSSRRFFRHERFGDVRPGCVFVNVARGEISPSTDLLRLMRESRLAGIGLDVFDHESDLAVSLRSGRQSADPEVAAWLELRSFPNVILTPHNAFNTIEAVERKAAQAAAEVVRFTRDGDFTWPVPAE